VGRATYGRPESVRVFRGVQRFKDDGGAFEGGSLWARRRQGIGNFIEQRNVSLYAILACE